MDIIANIHKKDDFVESNGKIAGKFQIKGEHKALYEINPEKLGA